MGQLLPLKSGYYVWEYVPLKALSVIALLLWLAALGLLSWRMFKSKTWFCTAFVVGCFMEFIGFCARAAAAEKTNKLMPYIIQGAFILLPPSLFAATIYMCLGRVVKLVGGEHLSLIRPSRLTKVFVSADIVSFMIQGGSSGLTILAFQHPMFGTIGKAMVIGGLVMQLISFSLFFYTAVSFYSHFRQAPTSRSFQIDGSWVQTIYMLYQVSWLIIIRSSFRIVEYSMGPTGYPLTHEWTLYVFDTIPMLAVALLFYLKYPDNLVLSREMGSELESQLSEERILPTKGWSRN